MTYLQFHFFFILPPLVLLAAGRPWHRVGPRAGIYLVLLAAIAFLYAAPWDNYLVWRGVWGYDPGRIIGVVGYVPIEEYLFFILQPLLAGCWLYYLLGYPHSATEARSGAATRIAGTVLYLALAAGGVASLVRIDGTYLGLILIWAAPILAAQWAYAGDRILARRRSAVLGILVPTAYLCIADAVAIRLGIWEISATHSFGLQIFGLPVEEAVFFLVTNVLVVQGLILFIVPRQSSARVPSDA